MTSESTAQTFSPEKSAELPKKRRKEHDRDGYSRVLRTVTAAGALIGFGVLAWIIIDLLIHGIPALKPDLFSWTYTSENVSLVPAFINTIAMVVLSLLISVPLSIGAAIYLCEYAKPQSRISQAVMMAVQTLSGVPSIVFGLFGSLFFVRFCHMGLSLLAGSLTMVLMILPVGIKTAQEALMEVPSSLREASYGLGAGKARTIFRIVLPSAAPGILNGIVLCIGRITGESAALIFTAGTLAKASLNLFSPARTLAVHMYALSSEGLHLPESYAAALILLILAAALNALSGLIGKKIERKSGHA